MAYVRTALKLDNEDLRKEVEQLRNKLTIGEGQFQEMQSEISRLYQALITAKANAELSDMAWKDNQAALKAQAETIARITAELEQCKHALEMMTWTRQCVNAGIS